MAVIEDLNRSIIDRFLGGIIQPPTIEGALAYMGLSPEEQGVDGTNYAWAFATEPATAGATEHRHGA